MEGSVSGGCVDRRSTRPVAESCAAKRRADHVRHLRRAGAVGRAARAAARSTSFVGDYDPELYERLGDRRAVVYTDLESGGQRLVFEGDDDATDGLITRDRRSLAPSSPTSSGRRRASSCSAPSTPARSSAAQPGRSAGGRSLPTHGHASRRGSACRAPTSCSCSGRTRRSRGCGPITPPPLSSSRTTTSSTSPQSSGRSRPTPSISESSARAGTRNGGAKCY